ncbi:MAG: pre-mRNA-splicing factor cwc2 [Piptocephalis tieghemiana]|nr:MAG: pre-mRNA-splicing factor cwc2 [Piptocephalis tieghemiana]
MSDFDKRQDAYMERPARIQVDPETLNGPNQSKAQPQGTTYNIWYHKWAGGDRGEKVRERAETRVDIELDSGKTRGTDDKNSYICVFFARGSCPHGYQCRFRHRLPKISDRLPFTKDVFGRDLFGQTRDDMGGVGTFMKDHCTLYVGKLPTEKKTAGIVRRHFQEFGPIERLNFLEDRGVAFIRYAHRYFAEFAKEAMSNQALDEQEIINVRWATEDPNPRAKADQQRRQEEMARQAIEYSLEEAARDREELEEKEAEAQKRVLLQGGAEEEEEEEGKRKRIKAITSSTDQETQEGKGEEEEEEDKLPTDGIFSTEALQSLRSMASVLHAPPAPPVSSGRGTSRVKEGSMAITTNGPSLVSAGYEDSDEE